MQAAVWVQKVGAHARESLVLGGGWSFWSQQRREKAQFWGLEAQVCLKWLYKTRVLSVFSGVRLVLLIMGAATSSLGRPPRSDVHGGLGGGIPVLGVLSHQQSLPPQSLLLDFF